MKSSLFQAADSSRASSLPRPKGLDPLQGESPPPLRVVPTFGLPHLFGWSRPSVSHHLFGWSRPSVSHLGGQKLAIALAGSLILAPSLLYGQVVSGSGERAPYTVVE